MNKKVLIVGNGKWSKTLQRVLTDIGQDFIVATYDWQQQLDQVSKAIVATPAATHFYIANELLRNKIPVLIEKPAVLTLEHAEILEDHSKITNTPIFCHTPYLYHSLIQELKSDFNECSYINYTSYRANVEGNHRDGNSFINHGTHDLANIWYLGVQADLNLIYADKKDNLINITAVNHQGKFNITTGEQQSDKVRHIRVFNTKWYSTSEPQAEVHIVADKHYLKNGLIQPKIGLTAEPLKSSLTDFIVNSNAKCGIDFIKWSSKVLQQVKDI